MHPGTQIILDDYDRWDERRSAQIWANALGYRIYEEMPGLALLIPIAAPDLEA